MGMNRGKILVTEDDALLRTMMCTVLAEAGYQAVEAFNGSDCLGRIQEENPDLVVMDLDMPKVRGDTAIQIIRRHEALRDIPILVVSGALEPASLEAMRFFEFGALLPKPFPPERLISAVNAQLVVLEHEDVRAILPGLGRRDYGLSHLASLAAGKTCDVYLTRFEGRDLRVLIPFELTRLEMTLLAEPLLSDRISILASIEDQWKRVWPRPRARLPGPLLGLTR